MTVKLGMIPLCLSCPSPIRSWCSRFNESLHKKQKDDKGKELPPALTEYERVCVSLKHIYVTSGNEHIFYN